MKSFKEFLIEALDPDLYMDRATKSQASLFIGRMQPIHNGHSAIIKMMHNPIVVVVKGKKTSEDKERNPFDFKYQAKLLKLIHPKVVVEQFPTGYIPDMINEYRKKGIEVDEVLAGEDRFNAYKGMIKSFNKQMPEEKQINVIFTKTPRVTSASKVRELIRADDEEGFKKEVPKQLWKEWNTMKRKLG